MSFVLQSGRGRSEWLIKKMKKKIKKGGEKI